MVEAGTSLSRRLKIGLVSPSLPVGGATNGIVTYVGVMRDALLTLGHDVTVFTVNDYLTSDGTRHEFRPLSPVRMPYERALTRWTGDPGDGGMGAARIRHSAATLVRAGLVEIIEMEESFGWGLRTAQLGVPVVLRLHGPHFLSREPIETPEQQLRSERRCIAEGKALHRAACITSPSSRLLAATVDHYGLTAAAETIRNPMPITQERWMSDRSDPDQILCVGRFDLRKGADIVLQAFELVLRARPEARLVMVGPDTGLRQANGSALHFAEYIGTSLPKHVAAKITHLGVLLPSDIQSLRLASACTVVGSRFECFPYAIAEAGCLGMPIVATDIFGSGEMIQDEVTGKLAPIDDVQSLAQALLWVLSDRDRAARLGAAARVWCADYLSPKSIAQETASFYHRFT